EQIVRNFSEAVRVSLYPCPNLLARSRASNHKQGHDALSSHTDRMTLREAYWKALQRTGQNCSPTDQLPSEPFVMPGVSCTTMFNNELCTSKPVVIDEAQFPEFVHEKTHSRPRRADHLGESLLADLGYYGL